MLERPGLLLGRGRDGGPCLAVTDLRSGEPLGVIRGRRPDRWPPWRWLDRPLWRVLETEDESLLLTARGPWGVFRPWEIRDAEDALVCTIHATLIFDSGGGLRGRLLPAAGAGACVCLDPRDRELASVRAGPHGTELCFAPLVEGDPYAKMALLGAALSASAALRLGRAS